MYMQLTCTSINCDTMCTMIEDMPVYIDDFIWRLMNSNVCLSVNLYMVSVLDMHGDH